MPDKKLLEEELVAEIRRLVLLCVQKVMADALYERERYLIRNWTKNQRRSGDWREYSAEKYKQISDILSQDDLFRMYCEGIDNLKWIESRMTFQSTRDPLLLENLQQEINILLKEVIDSMANNEQNTRDPYRRATYWTSRVYYQYLLNLLNSEYINPKARQLNPEFRLPE